LLYAESRLPQQSLARALWRIRMRAALRARVAYLPTLLRLTKHVCASANGVSPGMQASFSIRIGARISPLIRCGAGEEAKNMHHLHAECLFAEAHTGLVGRRSAGDEATSARDCTRAKAPKRAR
jgi:hypothetical protein